MIVPAVILILAGLVLIVVAVASWQERLPRNALAGLRTPSTMRSDQAFKVANKVAALLGKSSAGPVLFATALACAGLCGWGAMKGVRTARTL
jgi:hypothetical protein